MIIIFIREKIQLILAYILAIFGVGLIVAFAFNVLELIPHNMQVDFGGFVFITSPVLVIVSGINFIIFNIFNKSINGKSVMRKKFQIAFTLSVLPFVLIIASIGLFGF